MSYNTADGRYVHTEPFTATVASSSKTTSSNGSTQEAGGRTVIRNLTLNATARTGTSPTADVVLQGSDDGTNWYTLGAFTQLTSSTTLPATERKALPVARYIRVAWTIGGSSSPGYTFSVGVTSTAELV